MRVISGSLKGRVIKGFDIDGTRPTMDRVKESIFSSIQSYVVDSVVLDLFSGSGNLGIEAISNGAKKCYFVDNSNEAIKVINENINNFKINNSIILKLDYKAALSKLKDEKFDLIFLDPPYKFDYIDDIINYLLENDMINEKGLIICEYENDIKDDYNNLELFKYKKYGYKKVTIFKKI